MSEDETPPEFVTFRDKIGVVFPKPVGELREIPYVCIECDGKWRRYTDSRVLAPEPCPFCGGRSRMTDEEKNEPTR